MGADDTIRNTAEDLVGKAKEAVGKVTDDERLEAEGRADQTWAAAKKLAGDVKDVVTR